MNITQGTHEDRVQQLTKMYAAVNDEADDHYVWVEHNGDVHLDVKPAAHPSKKCRFYRETYVAGNNYVGSEAAADAKYIDDEVRFLERWWDYLNKNGPSVQGEADFADYWP